MEWISMKHYIERTSPKGKDQVFLGTCRLCGKENLGHKDMNEDCPNTLNLTEDEALLAAIEEK